MVSAPGLKGVIPLSDCALPRGRWTGVEFRPPMPVLHITMEFENAEPWEYQLALNGRKLKSISVEGVRYVPAPSYEEGCEVTD